MSLWKVADAETRKFFESYYHHLSLRAGRAEGIRITQMGFLTKAATRHPYYWSAFVSIGRWQPLRLFSMHHQ